ncbi:uncharacterized protein K444DRAFT_724876 [Hyaloscypha bicolor E]|uniref:Methyltransferase type 11 domain-containing protein n=1 Tax=Hyaloscypha bicolor E TaxID=1095630 RepID=A0A2J6T7T0_9HELO|nr:uncharacterized protein K444DRAFT_724876 [Hyaloscypha bicolor E]PMD59064.1 hypothetical protein K444DRAFT_724876 [Hyaloscypha bicolor E]
MPLIPGHRSGSKLQTPTSMYLLSLYAIECLSNHGHSTRCSHLMRAQKLTFPDNYFDLSFTNFVVTDLDDQKIVGQHLYRTLKPGGQAIVCTFAFCPHGDARRAAHLATRRPNAKLGLAYDPE